MDEMNKENVTMPEVPTEEKKSGNAARFLIPAAIFAVLVIILAGVAIATGIIGGNKNKVILKAAKKTFTQSGDAISKAWKMDEYADMFKEGQKHFDADIDVEESCNIVAEYNENEERFGLIMDVGFYGISMIQASLYGDDEEVRMGFPDLTDYVLYIDRENLNENIEDFIDEFDLDEDMADYLRQLNEESQNEELEQAYKQLGTEILKIFSKIKTDKTDAKDLMVNGSEKSCKGYLMTITGTDYYNCVLACKELYDENEAFRIYIDGVAQNGDYEPEDVEDAFEELLDECLEMDDVEVYFYLYDGVLAQVSWEMEDASFEWNIYGGNFPLERTELIFSNDFEEFVISRDGSMEGTEYQAEYRISVDDVDEVVFEAAFDKDTGDFSCYFEMSYLLDMSLEGYIDKTMPGSEYVINIDGLYYEDQMLLDGDITVSNECGEIEVPEGELFNVLKMTEEDWEEFVDDLLFGMGIY